MFRPERWRRASAIRDCPMESGQTARLEIEVLGHAALADISA